jgi:hypothetical protein
MRSRIAGTSVPCAGQGGGVTLETATRDAIWTILVRGTVACVMDAIDGRTNRTPAALRHGGLTVRVAPTSRVLSTRSSGYSGNEHCWASQTSSLDRGAGSRDPKEDPHFAAAARGCSPDEKNELRAELDRAHQAFWDTSLAVWMHLTFLPRPRRRMSSAIGCRAGSHARPGEFVVRDVVGRA